MDSETIVAIKTEIINCKNQLLELQEKLSVARGREYLDFLLTNRFFKNSISLDDFKFTDIESSSPYGPSRTTILYYMNVSIIECKYVRSENDESLNVSINYSVKDLDKAISHFEYSNNSFYDFAKMLFPETDLKSVDFMCSPERFSLNTYDTCIVDMEIYHGFLCSEIAVSKQHLKFYDIFSDASKLSRFRHLSISKLVQSPFNDGYSRILRWKGDDA